MSIYMTMLVLICLIVGGAFLLFRLLQVVRVRQAVIVLNWLTGSVHRVIVGPKTAVILPFEHSLTLDLSMQIAHLSANDIVTADLVVVISLDVFYALDPALLRAANLNRVLPSLNQSPKIIKSWADYILRRLISGFTTTELLTDPNCHIRLENQFRATLQDRVRPLGIQIYTARLTCRPEPSMLKAQLTATQAQLEAQAHAQALATLATVLGPERDLSQILPLELFQRLLQGDTGHLLTTLNLPLAPANKPATA